jgi:hypothetical protein
MNTTEMDPRSPAEIERDIESRRHALKGKLRELEYRLSPTERLRQARERIDPESIAPWAAVGAVATGTLLAARGLMRSRHAVNGNAEDADVDTIEETVCIDVSVPPGIVP